MPIPHHVAVIMDGNGRWAQARFLPRIEGHRRGIASLRKLVETARELGIANLSVFAFSSENWRRPKDEVDALMRFFVAGLQKEALPLKEAGVRLHVVGDTSVFDAELKESICRAQELTATAQEMHFNLCINYGGRWDIINAAKSALAAGDDLTTQTIERYLSMPWSGPVDLMIRTGGESRISNFILWQAAYAELWFTEVLWPEFQPEHLKEALQWYDGRQRRFGMTGDQLKN